MSNIQFCFFAAAVLFLNFEYTFILSIKNEEFTIKSFFALVISLISIFLSTIFFAAAIILLRF